MVACVRGHLRDGAGASGSRIAIARRARWRRGWRSCRR